MDASLDVANFDPFESGAIALDEAPSQPAFDPFAAGAIEESAAPAFFNPEPIADEIGIGEEVRGVGRSVLRGGRQFAQNFAVREMREQEQRQREYPAKLKQYEDDLANFNAENPSPGLIGAVQRKKLENVISGLRLELERATPKRKAAESAFSEDQAAIEKLPLTRAQEEFQKPETPWYSFFKNPVELSAMSTAESLPFIGGAAVGAVAGGPVGTAAAMGQLSHLAESSARIKQAMQNDGVDLKKPEAVMGWFNDRAKADPAIAKADLAALGPAAFDALTAGIAGRWLRGAVGKGVKPVAIATGKEIGVQMAGGGAGSVAGSVLAQESVDLKDILLEVFGELAPGEAISNVRAARRTGGAPLRLQTGTDDRGNPIYAEQPKEPNATQSQTRDVQEPTVQGENQEVGTTPAFFQQSTEIETAPQAALGTPRPQSQGAVTPTPAQRARLAATGARILIGRGVDVDTANAFANWFVDNSQHAQVGEAFREDLNKAFSDSGFLDEGANSYSDESNLRAAATANGFTEAEIQAGVEKRAARKAQIDQQNRATLARVTGRPESSPAPTPSVVPRTVTATEQPTNIPVSGEPNAPPPPVKQLGTPELENIGFSVANTPEGKKKYTPAIRKSNGEIITGESHESIPGKGGERGYVDRNGSFLSLIEVARAEINAPKTVTETPVLGSAEADLPAQQREQNRRNNEAQAAQMRAELEAMGVTVPQKAAPKPVRAENAQTETTASKNVPAGTQDTAPISAANPPTPEQSLTKPVPKATPKDIASQKQNFGVGGNAGAIYTADYSASGFGTERLVTVRNSAGNIIGQRDPFYPNGIPVAEKTRKARIATVAREIVKDHESKQSPAPTTSAKLKPEELAVETTAPTPAAPPPASPEATPSVVDQAITKIEDLQKRLRGSGSDVSMGVPKAILDLALETARLALIAGRTVAQAIDAAIAKIRESVATFDEAEVRETLERELAANAGDNLQHEEEPRAQVAGIPEIGQIRPTEHLPEILAAVREKVIDARKPLAETLEQAWSIARELTDPSPAVRAGSALKYHQTIGGADAGLVTLKQEIMLVGLKQALAGDDSLLRYTFDNSADFQTSMGGGATSVGRALRGEQGEFYGALYKSLRDIFGDQKLSNAQIASALDRETFFDLIAGLKDMKLSPEEIATVLETGKTPEGDTLRDILEREGKPVPPVKVAESAEQVAARILDRYATSQSDTLSWTPQTWNTVREVFKGLLNGDVTHDEFRGTLDSLKVNRAITESLIGVAMRELDIRKQLMVVRARERRDDAWQREAENLATQGQRTAERALNNLELKNAGAEWLKPGNRNRVRDILNKAFSPTEPILQDPRPWIDALRDELEAAGVDFPTATQLAQQVYQARETQWVNANLLAMERAAESGSIRSLVEAVIADPYRAQNSPEWLRKTAVNWFMSNGLTPERAEAAYKLFEPQFRKALADAQEKVARQVLESKRKDPRTIKELVTLIRSGVLNPSRNWLDELAERRGWKKPTAEQYGKLEELDEQLAQPDLSPLERRDIVEQQHRIIRHLGKLDGQAARTVAESFLASLLTGFRTFTVQFTAAVAGLRDVAIASASNPANTLQFVRALKNAVVGNLKSQLNYTWQKGISTFHINEVEQNFSQLERLHEDVMAAFKAGTPAQKAAAAAKYLFAQQRWVLRALNAMDSASAAVIREYKLAYYSSLAFKEAGLDTHMISELLDAQQQMRQAEYEKWINVGLDHDRAHLRANATVDRTTRDFLSGKGVEGRLIDAVFQSAENDSYSVVGRLAPGVQETGKGVSEGFLSKPMNAIVKFVGEQKAKGGWSTIAAQTMFGFVAIPWRATRFASTFMWYGLVRNGIDAYRTKRGRPTFWKQSYANVLQSRARLREAIAGTVVGVAAGLLLPNTSDDDDKDGGFKVFATGAGPTNKNLKDAWIKRGFQSYALNFKINGRIASIPLTRIGEFIMYPFIIASAIDDAKWKQKERALTGKPPADPISLYAATLVGEHLSMMGQRGLLQTGGQLYQSMQQTGSFGKGVARLAAGTAAGIAIPFKQLLSSISDMFVGPLDNSSAQAIVANAFPIVGLPFQHKAVNRFGDQMYDRSWYGRIARTGVPIAFQVDRSPENQRLYPLLVSDGAAPPELRRGSLENKYGPLTDNQFADFAKKSGALLKQSALSNLSNLQQATPAEVKSFLSKSASQADKTAAAALGLKPLAKPETEATEAGASLRAATSTATVGASVVLPATRRPSTGNLRASLSRRTRTHSLGRVRLRLGRTRLATMRVPRLRRGRLRASLSRPRVGRFSVRSRMARTRRPRVRYA